MKFFALILALLIAISLLAQDTESPDRKLPSGKSQREEILKEEHEKSMREVDQLLNLAGDLKAELEKNDYHVLSISCIKKTEEIEKLARRIRSRIKR